MTETTEAALERYRQLAAAGDSARSGHYRDLVTSYYDLVTDLYLEGWGASHHFAPLKPGDSHVDALAARQKFLADRAGLRPGMKVLDVGSGVGGPALNIAGLSGAHVTGLDLTPGRVERARTRARDLGLQERTTFVEGDAMDMPFEDASFDVVYAFEAICHTADKDRAHAEVARVLKPGGLSIGYEWLAGDGLTTGEVRRLVEPVCRYYALPHLATPGGLAAQLRRAGFTGIVVGDAEATGDLASTWDYLDELAALGEQLDDSPVRKFMVQGARALTRAAREGAFLIEFWEARKPGAPSA
ncbi:methyltransferase domain-containing protein [Streptomyces sp. SCA3-4]|uniref:class I SAM-dependent methyltransferase n=1 Tax=Streptomyces sichuanensis TaxID=2871810 RepID=UPI001CE2FEA9|nr:methyltransferase domain-containing protein [Streptomyces sichuanensis]MCA6094843.1 methyltransferase domain-containing protein [Streptomyces sichuanensis]